MHTDHLHKLCHKTIYTSCVHCTVWVSIPVIPIYPLSFPEGPIVTLKVVLPLAIISVLVKGSQV